jgi:ASC-1-like (ASCH) protein
MKFEVRKMANGKYELRVGDEIILVHEKLSSIVLKIEQYLKLRFLSEEPKTPLGKLGDIFK